MVLVDCFTFFNELDMLEYRLKVLYDVVDYFVLVEAVKTYSGIDKPLYYNENKARYEKYSSKIIHVIVDDLPITNNPWTRERHQRNAIIRGLKQLNLNDDDQVIVGDMDEIPDPNVIGKLKGEYILDMDLYYYDVNHRFSNNWPVTKLVTYRLAKSVQIEDIRGVGGDSRYTAGRPHVKCGWHLSYFLTPELIVEKIKSFSHQEYNHGKYIDVNYVKECIKNGVSMFNNNRCPYISLEDNKYPPPFAESLYFSSRG